MSEDVYIVAAQRTPMGGFQGSLASLTAPELGSHAIKSAVEVAGIDGNDVDEVIMGQVLTAGIRQAPARQAAIGAGLPNSCGALTINKMCGSGLKAVMLACDSIKAGSNSIVVAGGMESMTNAPYILPKARDGYRMGHNQVLDHMFFDGLEDAYDKGALMGTFAEQCASKFGFTREQQDEFAISSLQKASEAAKNGAFQDEIAPLIVKSRKSEISVDFDDGPRNAKLEKIPQLKPAFKKDGTVTAANSSSISDGAAAIVLMSESKLQKDSQPLAKVVGYATHSQEPAWFTTAPVGAMQTLMKNLNWSKDDVDLFEINEAFAVVSMAGIAELELDPAKVNIHGGACALGHPIGGSGARILVTLIHALKKTGGKKGIASLCIGGGEAVAVGIEMV